jgi:uncharacterized protein
MPPILSDPMQPLLSKEALDLLEKHHQFPGEYMFKAIGFGGDEFASAVQRAAETVLGPLVPGEHMRARPSSGGRYLAVTLEVEVRDGEQVLAVYQALRAVAGLAILI